MPVQYVMHVVTCMNAENGSGMETGNRNWKWKLEMEIGNGNWKLEIGNWKWKWKWKWKFANHWHRVFIAHVQGIGIAQDTMWTWFSMADADAMW